MAFEINDLKGFFILVLFAIPRVASTNINCSGRAFHCVNSTHFMICVDLGGGVSTTIDDFVIPCPATTVCHENNIFECDFPDVTTPSLHVIGVSKQSDISEVTLVTNSVITTTPTSDITDVFKENFTATTLPIAEDVTPVVKLEVLENIMNPIGVNSDNTTETSFKVTSNFTDSAIETTTSDNIITTLATDNNYTNLETDVGTSTQQPVNTSSTDKSTFFDTATSNIGLINIISTAPPSAVSIKSSYNVLTSLDISNDNTATTTEKYDTKEVTMHVNKVENVIDNLNIPTDITYTEKSVFTVEVNKALVPNTLILNDTNNKIESKNQPSDNLTIAEQKIIGKGNTNKNLGNTNKTVPETTKKYVTPTKIINISEPIIVALNPQTTTHNTLVSLGQVDLISVKPKHNMPSTNDYIDTFYGDTAKSTTIQFNTKLETILSEKPVIAEITSTTPTANTTLQRDTNNGLTGDIVTVEKVTETNKNSLIPETMTVASMQTSITNNFVSITTEATMDFTMDTIATSETLFNNDSPVEKQTIVNQPLEPITTDTPIVVTDTIYQIHGDLNKTLISTENISANTMSTIEISTIVINSSNTDIVNDKVTAPILLPPATMKNPAIEITTAEPLQNVFTTPIIEVKNELRIKSTPIIANEHNVENVKNDTLLYNNDHILNTTVTVKTVLKASSLDMDGIGTESTKRESEAKNELKTTNVDGSNLGNYTINALLSVYTTPASYKVISDSVTNATIKDLTSQSDIVTNPQTSFTSDITHKITHQTTEKVVTDPVNKPVNKITAHMNQLKNLETVIFPDNLNSDQLPKTIQDVLGKTTSNLNNIEPTPFSSDFTEKIRPIDIIQYNNKNNISTTKAVNSEDVLLLSQESPAAHYGPGISKNTPNISDTTRINVESEKVSESIPTNVPVDIYRAFTMSYQIETTTTLPVAFRSSTNIENDGDVTTTTLPLQEVAKSSVDRVRQLNATSATAGIISEMVPFFDKSVVSNTKNTDLNTQTLIDYSETTTSQVDVDVNKTATARPITGNINDNTTTSPSLGAHTTKDENIAIVSTFNIVNSSGNVMPSKTLELTSLYSSLLNDIKSSESQALSGYVTATDNVPDHNSVYVDESVTQKNLEVILSSAETKVMNSVLSTANTHILPSTEINTGKNKYIRTEAPVPSTIELKHINPTTTDYVTEKPNDYFSTEAMLTQSNKLPNVQADFLVSPLSSVLGTVVAPNGFTTLPVYNEVTTIDDSAFIINSTQTAPELVTDNNINMSIEIPRLTSKVADPQIAKYNTESLLPISEPPVAQTTTEPTRTTNVFTQTTPVVQPEVKTMDLPQYLLRTLNSNIELMSSLPITKFTPAQMTTESTHTRILAQSTSLTVSRNTSLSVPEIQTTNLPQYVTSTVNDTTEVTGAQTTPCDNTNQNRIKTANLAQYVTSKVNNNVPQSMPSLNMLQATASQMITQSTDATLFAETTPLTISGTTNSGVLPRIKPIDLPQYVMSRTSDSIPKSMPSLPMTGVTTSQITTEPTQIPTTFADTTPLAAPSKTDQNILHETLTKDLPQYVMSRTSDSIPKSMPSLPITGVTTSQITTEPTRIPTTFADTTPLAAPSKTDQNILHETLTKDLPQYVMSRTSDSIPKSMPSLPMTGVTTSQMTTEPTRIPTTFADTTPLAAPSKTDQNVLHETLTKDLPQYVTTAVTYNNPPTITNIRTESITDSLIAPDTMVETIKIVGDQVSGTHLGDTIMSDVESISTTVNKADDSIKSFTNHESIVVRATSKNYEQNTPGKPVDNNKAEIVNHTESNWMSSDVNIESIKIKKSSIDEDLSVLKSFTNVKNKTLDSDSAIISKIQPRAGISDDNFEYKSTTVATYYKQAELGASNNVTQSNTKKITKENKNAEKDSSVNTNIEIIDVKKYQVPFDSKNISDSYSIHNTKANITPLLSLQNSTINDELEQHLISTNHTITAEVQSHLNENDKQSNKTSYELTLNVTSIQNPNLKSTKLNASSKDTTVITIPVSVFNCSNFTRGKYADKKDCRKFYTCIGNLQPILGTCPNNTVFSEINKQCTRNLSHCVRNNQFRCLFEGRFSDFFKDNIYYICVKNRMNGFIRYKLQCQNNYHLNKDSVKCEKNEEISTQVSSVSETINDESTLKPKSEKIISSDNFECEKEGKFPYVKDCSKYYVCTKIKNVYRRKIVKCASEEVFDKEKKKCVESDSGEC